MQFASFAEDRVCKLINIKKTHRNYNVAVRGGLDLLNSFKFTKKQFIKIYNSAALGKPERVNEFKLIEIK